MNDIKVEEVEGYSDARQPNVTMLMPKAHLKEAKTISVAVPITHNIHEPSEKIQQIDNHPKESGVKDIEKPITDHQIKESYHSDNEDVSPEVPVIEIIRIDPLTIKSDNLSYRRHTFKNVKPRQPYISKESYRSLLRSSTGGRSISHQAIKHPSNTAKQPNKVKKDGIFDRLPGLIDFGLTHDVDGDNDNSANDDIEEMPEISNLRKNSSHRTLTSIRNIDKMSVMQEEISKRVLQRQSACKLKQMERYLNKFQSYENLFTKKEIESIPEYRPLTSISKALSFKPPTEKERAKVVDFNEKYRFRIKTNKFQNSIYGKPVCRWGIKVGDEKHAESIKKN
jgi:hypothetical protein